MANYWHPREGQPLTAQALAATKQAAEKEVERDPGGAEGFYAPIVAALATELIEVRRKVEEAYCDRCGTALDL